MNRDQRRQWERSVAREKKKLWPSGFLELPPTNGIADGDKVTIAGIKRFDSGAVIYNCNRGEETIWIAKINPSLALKHDAKTDS
jgi:hypothetical protein